MAETNSIRKRRNSPVRRPVSNCGLVFDAFSIAFDIRGLSTVTSNTPGGLEHNSSCGRPVPGFQHVIPMYLENISRSRLRSDWRIVYAWGTPKGLYTRRPNMLKSRDLSPMFPASYTPILGVFYPVRVRLWGTTTTDSAFSGTDFMWILIP